MSATASSLTSPRPPTWRKVGLIVAGIVCILTGAASGCLALLMPLMLLVGKLPMPPGQAVPPHVDPQSVVTGMLCYLAIGGTLVWLGIGSIRLRRWVRPLVLIVGWTWLLTGVLVMALMIVGVSSVSATLQGASPQTPLPANLITVVIAFLIVFGGGLLVVLPGALVIFYQSRGTRAALAYYDPKPGWTDRVPTQVLGVALGQAFAVVCLPLSLFYMTVPVFGFIVTGWPAAVILLGMTIGFAALAYATYHRHAAAWWLTALATLLLATNAIVTFARISPLELYKHMGIAQADLALLQHYPWFTSRMVIALIVLVAGGWLVFLLTIRRQFYEPSCSHEEPRTQ